MEETDGLRFDSRGLFDKQIHTVPYKDINAVVSIIPFKEMQPDAETITAHQRVIEESRKQGTTLPVRFGIMFKSDDGVKQMLAKSYKDMTSKITKFRGKDEFGLKIIMDQADLKKFSTASENNLEIKKLKGKIASSGQGAAYFLKMKMDEAIRNETYKRIEKISGYIHSELTNDAQESSILKSDFDQIFLNAAYLIDRKAGDKFHKKLDSLKDEYKSEGLIFHLSGPWAPYSFC